MNRYTILFEDAKGINATWTSSIDVYADSEDEAKQHVISDLTNGLTNVQISDVKTFGDSDNVSVYVNALGEHGEYFGIMCVMNAESEADARMMAVQDFTNKFNLDKLVLTVIE